MDSLVPIKTWKLSEFPRMVTGPDGSTTEVRQSILPPIYKPLDEVVTAKDVDASIGEFHDNWAEYLVALHRFNAQVLEYYQTQAIGRKSTIVFCSRIYAVHDLQKHFRLANIVTRCISSRTAVSERNGIVTSFRDGAPCSDQLYDVDRGLRCAPGTFMVSVRGKRVASRLTRKTDCIILARPTSSVILHNQMVSRVSVFVTT